MRKNPGDFENLSWGPSKFNPALFLCIKVEKYCNIWLNFEIFTAANFTNVFSFETSQRNESTRYKEYSTVLQIPFRTFVVIFVCFSAVANALNLAFPVGATLNERKLFLSSTKCTTSYPDMAPKYRTKIYNSAYFGFFFAFEFTENQKLWLFWSPVSPFVASFRTPPPPTP